MYAYLKVTFKSQQKPQNNSFQKVKHILRLDRALLKLKNWAVLR